MPLRISNINLFVADVAVSARFYESVFGLEWDQSAGPSFAYLGGGGGVSITLQGADAPGAMLGSAESVEIGFETDDLPATHAKLVAAGVEVSPIQVMGWGSAFDARDPNGFRLTVILKAGS